MVADNQYTVEIYEGDIWIRQVDVFNTYDEANEYCEANPIEEPEVYSIWCIEYDENDNEIKSYPVV